MPSLAAFNDDIDPAILADVTRVVQELMRMQQLEQQHDQLDDYTAFDPYYVPGNSSFDDHDILHYQYQPCNTLNAEEQAGCVGAYSTLPPSSPTSSLSSCEQSSSSASSFETAPASPSSSPTPTLLLPFQLEESALPPQKRTSAMVQPLHATLSSEAEESFNDSYGGGSDQVLINLLPGQISPTRATSAVKVPSSYPAEPHRRYSKPIPGGAIKISSSPSSRSKLVIPRSIPSSPTRPRRKRALLIGINYFGDPNQLLGCINDTRDVFGFLNGYFSFRYQDTIMLTDDQIYEDKRPTGANIRYWMKWLVKDAEPHDSLFFHYAGHGGRIKDFSYNGKSEHLGDEADGYDEIIYPCDYLRSGIISDDEMYDLMVKELPAGVQLTALVDACHSGTMLDLPYVYNGNHVTALEKVTRTKVGAMAAMSASDVQFDLPGSNNGNVQTQTTTTTTTTTTTVTMTSGGLSPVVTQFTNGSVMTSDGHLSPPDGLPPIHTKDGATPLSPGQSHCTRSMAAGEDAESESTEVLLDDLVPQLTITSSDSHNASVSLDDSSSGLGSTPVPSSLLSVPSQLMQPGLMDGMAPSRRQRTKSVSDIATMDEVYTGVEDVYNDHRGIECDSREWMEPSNIISIDDIEIAVQEYAGIYEDEDSDDEEGMEEARKMAMFRETKGNVVMFSGCRDDQASADIRASAKDAAIIKDHHAAVTAAASVANGTVTAANWGSPTAMNSLDDDMPNPLGYSLPQPYTSPMARGAVSYAWIQCLSQKPNQTYEELLMSMRYFMKQRDLEQIPQLGSGMPMDMRAVFTL